MGFAPLSPSYDVKECKMPLPQDIRPVFQDIQDTLVQSDAPWIERSPKDKLKVLWIGRETGTWASLHHWKKGLTHWRFRSYPAFRRSHYRLPGRWY